MSLVAFPFCRARINALVPPWPGSGFARQDQDPGRGAGGFANIARPLLLGGRFFAGLARRHDALSAMTTGGHCKSLYNSSTKQTNRPPVTAPSMHANCMSPRGIDALVLHGRQLLRRATPKTRAATRTGSPLYTVSTSVCRFSYRRCSRTLHRFFSEPADLICKHLTVYCSWRTHSDNY